MEALSTQSQQINFIPCIKWVKRGVSKSNPEKVQLTKEELLQVIKDAKSKLRIQSTNADGASGSAPQDNDVDEYNFNTYDEEDDSDALRIDSFVCPPTGDDEEYSESESEKEDEMIKPNDNLIIAGHVEGDASILEIYVYNEEESSLYVHHDYVLPSIPLCLEWMDYEPGQDSPGNLCAVGSMSSVIDIWDLDIVNCLEPAYKLGRASSRRKGITRIGHADAVLDLAWNKLFHHILASASVDKTVLLWDVDAGQPHTTLSVFEDKVQCLRWHKFEAQTLLAAGCDGVVRVFDCRTQDDTHQRWPLGGGEVERVLWHPFEPFCFLAATSIGTVHCIDCRKGSLWQMTAHEASAVTGLVASDQCRGLIVTTSSEGTLKVWDSPENAQPVLVLTKDMQMGTLQCLESCPDLPFVVAMGGDYKANHFCVLSLQSEDAVNERFGSRSLEQLSAEQQPTCETQEMDS